jgi:hypothetical protein
VAKWQKGSPFDPASIAIVVAAFDDLIERGFDRHEIELVFRPAGSDQSCMLRRMSPRRTITVACPWGQNESV